MERPLLVLGLVAVLAAGCKCKETTPPPAEGQGGAAFEIEEDEDGKKETPVDIANLPAGVRSAAEAAAPGLKVTASQMEDEDGVPVYEVTGTVDGAVVEVLVTPEGKVLVIERSIPVDSVPEAVRAAAAAKVPGLVVAMAEEIRKAGATRAEYELKGKADGKSYELKLTDAGEVLELED